VVKNGDIITLDGSASSDANGDTLTFDWSFISKPDGSEAILSDSTVENPTFIADVAGIYKVKLVVTDGYTESNAYSEVISSSSENTTPLADAGVDQSVAEGEMVFLDGNDSIDTDYDTLTYEWSFITIPDSSDAILLDSTAVDPSFEADLAGIYTLQLIVKDGIANSKANSVNISVSSETGVDLDIKRFRVTRKVRLYNDEDDLKKKRYVRIKLRIKNNGIEDGPRPATVIGMQNGEIVYQETKMVSGANKKIRFPKYLPEDTGKIKWTVTIEDDDPDEDKATAKTKVKKAHHKNKGNKWLWDLILILELLNM
jgi:PKD repeat protein